MISYQPFSLLKRNLQNKKQVGLCKQKWVVFKIGLRAVPFQ